MKNNNNINLTSEIEIALERLNGMLVIMCKLNSYEPDKSELNDLLDTIADWGAKFQAKLNLSFISREELLDVYNRLDRIKEKYLFDPSIGNEAELSDKIVTWMWELMILRKKQIERMK